MQIHKVLILYFKYDQKNIIFRLMFLFKESHNLNNFIIS
jgi:hypothetical protein